MGGPGSGSVEPLDHVKIGRDLLAWAQLPDSINLNKFCAIYNLRPTSISDMAKKHPDFTRAYEITKAHLAARREELLNSDKLHVKAYDLNATVYDQFTREEKDRLAKQENENRPSTVIVKASHDGLGSKSPV